MTTKTLDSPKPKTSNLPPWNIVLWNDEINPIEFIVEKVAKIATLTKEIAEKKAVEAHEKGKSLLLTTHKEKAELIVEQFTSHKITVTMKKT